MILQASLNYLHARIGSWSTVAKSLRSKRANLAAGAGWPKDQWDARAGASDRYRCWRARDRRSDRKVPARWDVSALRARLALVQNLYFVDPKKTNDAFGALIFWRSCNADAFIHQALGLRLVEFVGATDIPRSSVDISDFKPRCI